jgi:hypothetical protein
VYGLAFAITIASGSLVYRQRLTSYRIVRSLVLGIYVLIFFQMVQDLLRETVLTEAHVPVYSAVITGLGLSQAVLLVAAAQGIYFSPAVTYRTYFKELRKGVSHALTFGVFVAMAIFVLVFGTVLQPPTAATVVDFAGRPVPSVAVPGGQIALVVALLAFFLAYPTALMVVGARKVEAPRMRRSLFGLALGWAAVSALYVATEYYMWTSGTDASGLMYLANSVIFFGVIRNFRRSASLAGFVETAPAAPRQEGGQAPAGATSPLAASLAGKKLLYEVDPSVPYEATLRGTLEELAWAGNAVFVLTPRASPLHDALTGATGVKFFLTTGGVSYMKVAEDTREVLIPQNDSAVFLDVVDRTLASVQGPLVFVFDSVSDLLLMNGMEKAYKFLKQVLELLHEPRATGVFIFIGKAHEDQDANLLRGIFPSYFVEDARGPRLAK